MWKVKIHGISQFIITILFAIALTEVISSENVVSGQNYKITNYTLVRFQLTDPENATNVCILLETALNITIHYETSNETVHTITFPLLPGTSVLQDAPLSSAVNRKRAPHASSGTSLKPNHRTGTLPTQRNVTQSSKEMSASDVNQQSHSYCGMNTQRMCIWFWPPVPERLHASASQTWNPWQLCFEFTRELDVQEDPNQGWSSVGAPPGGISGAYHLRNVTLMYQLDHPIFIPKPNNYAPGYTSVHITSTSRFASRVNDYYMCNHGTTVKLSHKVELSFVRLRLQTFSSKGSSDFTGSYVICDEDLENDHTIGYIFLGVVALLLVIVMIGFVLGRQREGEARKATGSSGGYVQCQTHSYRIASH